MKRRLHILIFTVAAVAFLSDCSRIGKQTTPVTIETATEKPYALPTPTVLTAQTLIPDAQLSPTALSLSPDETSKEVLFRLLETNGDCKLPCLLGLTPGMSGVAETSAFQAYFHTVEYPLDVRDDNNVGVKVRDRDDGAGIRFQFWKGDTASELAFGYYTVKDVVSQIVFSSWSSQFLENGARSLYDDPNYKEIFEYYSLKNILSMYGPPSRIIIAPFPDIPEYPSPPAQYSFSVVVIYDQQGFLIQYVSVRDQDNKHFIACPLNSHIDISVWDPETNLDLSNAVAYFSGVDSINRASVDYFRDIEDATQFDINTFYEAFKSSDSPNCIKTTKELWLSR